MSHGYAKVSSQFSHPLEGPYTPEGRQDENFVDSILYTPVDNAIALGLCHDGAPFLPVFEFDSVILEGRVEYPFDT